MRLRGGLLAVLLAAGGCSAKAVRPQSLLLCAQGRCETVADEASRQRVLVGLHELLRQAKGGEIAVFSADSATRAEKKRGVSFFVQGGPIPGRSTISGLQVEDVLFIDRQTSQTKARVKTSATYVGVPLLCSASSAEFSVLPDEASLRFSNLCTWVGIGTTVTKFEWMIDRVDLDAGAVSGYWSARTAGLPVVGGGSGYMLGRFRQQAKTEPPPKAVAAPPIELALEAKLTDQDNDSILEGGEEIVLSVAVENNGRALAPGASVAIAGPSALVDCLGKSRDLGTIIPQESAAVEFKCRLPAKVFARKDELRVEARAAKKKIAGTTIVVELKPLEEPEQPVAKAVPAPATPVRPAPVEEVEVISQAVSLRMAVRLKDQNGNRLLEGGEEIAIVADVENAGASPVEAQVALSGERALTDCLGAGRSGVRVGAGQTTAVEFKCRLPADVPSETVALRLELRSGGELLAARILRVGMKPAIESVTEEVVSELSVDDVPLRAKAAGGNNNVALVIGLGRYREKLIPAVKYAVRDAEVMARYLENIAGVPSTNIKVLTDDSATRSDLEAYVEDWLPRHVAADSTVFVYYAGHGTPDVSGKEAFLVPYEGHPDFPAKLYPLKRMYDALAKLPAKAVVVMLDSCFSGAKGRGLAREGARPLVHAMDHSPAAGSRVMVIAGASGNQIASDLDPVEHGLFTYFLLKGLRGEADADRDGTVNLGELYAFVKERVARRASADFNRDQTPVLIGETAAAVKLPLARR